MNTELGEQDLGSDLDEFGPEQAGPEQREDGSVLGRLRATRERAAQDTAPTRDFVVPGYADGLVIRCLYPDGGYKAAIKAAVREESKTDKDARLNGAADLLQACCGSLLGRLGDGTHVDLLTDAPVADGELPEVPLRFDRKMAEAFKIEVPATVVSVHRFVARALFSPRGLSQGQWDGDLALISTSNQIFRWLNKSDAEADESFAGE